MAHVFSFGESDAHGVVEAVGTVDGGVEGGFHAGELPADLQEVAVGGRGNLDVAGFDAQAVFVGELDEHFVEVLDIAGVAFGLYGEVLIGDVGKDFHTRGNRAGKLQVEV